MSDEISIKNIVSKRLREWRAYYGITQAELAERASLSVNAIRLVESGGRRPRGSTLDKIIAALEIQESTFYAGPALRDPEEHAQTSLREGLDAAKGLRDFPFEHLMDTIEQRYSGADPEAKRALIDLMQSTETTAKKMIAAASDLNRDLPIIESAAPALASYLENRSVSPELLAATREAAELVKRVTDSGLSEKKKELLELLASVDEIYLDSLISSLRQGLSPRVNESKRRS